MTDDVSAWLEELGLSKYREIFSENEIDVEVLPDLTEDDLEKLNIPLGPRKKLLKAIARFVQKNASTDASTETGQIERLSGSDSSNPIPPTATRLAERILNSRSALEGERKQVTILFADIKSSTELIETIDAESANQILEPVLRAMMAAVQHYEGTVNKIQGDGLMAIFGAPLAYEDHAVRACYAALDMQTAVHDLAAQHPRDIPTIQIRVGLHSGEVIVRAINNDLSMNYDAVGMTVHLASRMEQHAQPGSICLTRNTMRLAHAYITVKPLGPTLVKGLSKPVDIFSLTGKKGARTRLQAAHQSGLTPFVGRQRELEILDECFRQAQTGQGQVVFLVGDPGIGKSRLLYEFRQRIKRLCTWNEGHTMSFGQNIPFHLHIDLMKRNLGIDDDDTEQTIGDKIKRSVLRVDKNLVSIIPYLRYLLGIDPNDTAVTNMDPKLRRNEIFDALRQLMLRAAEAKPQVLVYEDLHWSDRASEEFLRILSDSIPTTRVLCLITYRPGHQHTLGERTFHTRLALKPLDQETTQQVARSLLDDAQLPAALETLILKKAEGNPFFVEEVLESLKQAGTIRHSGNQWRLTQKVEDIVVPDTIQDVLMARIDRLETAPRNTLQLASVIGREFTERLLIRLGDIRDRTAACLQELKAIELIHEKSLYPELAYMFKHALTQDIAYHSLLTQHRQRLHGVIGQAIEELYADKLAEHYEMLAHHYTKGENWPKALQYLIESADKAADACAVQEAIDYYDQALSTLQHFPPDQAISTQKMLHHKKAELFPLISDFDNAHKENHFVAELAKQTGDALAEGTALAAMAENSMFNHQLDRALEESRRVIAIGHQIDAQQLLAAGHYTKGHTQAVIGYLQDARKNLEISQSLSAASRSAYHQSMVVMVISELDAWQGNYGTSILKANDAVAIARQHNLLFPLLNCLWSLGLPLVAKGDYDAAMAAFSEALSLAEKFGAEIFRNRILNSLGWLYAECGDLPQAIEFNTRASDFSSSRGDPECIANSELNLGDAFLAQGDLVTAKDFFEKTQRLVKKPSTSDWMRWRYSQHLFAGLAELALKSDEPKQAETFCNQCLDLATRSDSKKYLVRGWRIKAEIAVARMQWADAETALVKALHLAEAIGNPTQLWKTRVALGQLAHKTKQNNEAEQHYRAAQRIIEQMTGQVQHPDLLASWQNSTVFQPVRELSQI